MQSKLTLRLDSASIEAAKATAANVGVSLSAHVEQMFKVGALLTQNRRSNTAWVQQLRGAGRGTAGADPTDQELRDELIDRIVRKHT